MEVTLIFEKAGDKSFSCLVEEDFEKFTLIGYGKSVREAEEDVYIVAKELKEMGYEVPELEVAKRKYDIGSFFNYFPINITQFAHFYGMNASMLRQYASLQRTPRKARREQLATAIQDFGKLLSDNRRVIDID